MCQVRRGGLLLDFAGGGLRKMGGLGKENGGRLVRLFVVTTVQVDRGDRRGFQTEFWGGGVGGGSGGSQAQRGSNKSNPNWKSSENKERKEWNFSTKKGGDLRIRERGPWKLRVI